MSLKHLAITILVVFTVVMSLFALSYYWKYTEVLRAHQNELMICSATILAIEKNLSDQNSVELRQRVDYSLDFYMTHMHQFGKNLDQIVNQSQYNRVVSQANEAGYDFSGPALSGIRMPVQVSTPGDQ